MNDGRSDRRGAAASASPRADQLAGWREERYGVQHFAVWTYRSRVCSHSIVITETEATYLVSKDFRSTSALTRAGAALIEARRSAVLTARSRMTYR